MTIAKNLGVVGIKEEVTEGTFVAPDSTTSYVAPIEIELVPAVELLERTILNSGLGKASPKLGVKSSNGSISVEQRGSGVEGAQTDAHSLIKATLGGNREITSQNTSKSSGNTDQVLAIEDADIGDYTVGDIVCVLESGDHFVSPITVVVTTGGSATITLLRTRAAGVFSNSVVISKSQMYFPSNAIADYPTLSVSYYKADTKRAAGAGMRCSSMALENWSTGQLSNWAFGLDGLSFTEVDGASPHSGTIVFDDETPASILSACVYQNATSVDLNEFSFSIENSIGFSTSTCSANGRIASRFNAQRTITANINPYSDATSVQNFTDFDNGNSFSLFAYSANPSGTSGELDLGSIVGYYFPSCMITNLGTGDVDGLITDDLTLSCDGGSAGSDKEIYIGII